MGQPKFNRSKYDTPNHPWQGERIKAEHELRKKFGLKNKTEIWKAQTRLREIRGQARGLISRSRNPDDQQATVEAKNLLLRLHRQGYVGEDATLNDVLGLDVERILNRRLQSQVYLKGMARTPGQARQFVSHGLIQIGERRVTVPSYTVRREEEEQIQFKPEATMADPAHPVRPRAPGADALAEVAPKAREAPAATPEAAPEAKPEAAETTTEAKPEAAPETPAATPEATPEAQAERTEATPEAKAEPTEAAPQATAAPDATPEAKPEAAPEATSEAKPEPAEATTEAKPEAAPEPAAVPVDAGEEKEQVETPSKEAEE